MHACHRIIRIFLTADLEDGRVTLLFTDEELCNRFLRRAFAAGHEQHAEHLECVARCQTERTADEHVDLLQTGELDQVGRGRAGNPGNALADRFPALGGDNEHLTAVAQILGDPAVFICYANVHNRPSTVLSAPESSSGSFASSILPASTAAASFGSIGSFARTGSS